ncbi:unnamed protein product [Nippostrongylus brasiliensis]|uniref:3-oxoacyl-[acyl-carrier-protein] reductase n=1 Tax=Nippostrongylus brasiliensis TaxID=27835 RepID=A0A0N4XHZ4_NIPBR|nr:unnamed protein product [Nippostrongylus brasiliensis]
MSFHSAFFLGSSSGIGASTALLFAKEGAFVTITGRKQDRLKATHDSIVAAGVPEDRIHSFLGDIREEEVQKQLINGTVAKFGRLDILVGKFRIVLLASLQRISSCFLVKVNNAGGTVGKPGFDASDEDFVYNIEFSLMYMLFSVMQLVRLARPHLIASKGEIVNISSVAGKDFAFPTHPYYAIAKAGLDQLTRALAIDLIDHGVRVNGVSPGIVETKFMENCGLSEEHSKKVYKFYSSQKIAVPRGSNGTPEEIASVIAFLCDRQVSSYIVGQMIVVDGGTSLVMGAGTFDFEKIISS